MDQTLDILHSSTSLEWEEWPSLPVKMKSACSVYLNGTLYVGGGVTDEPGWEDDAALYSFKPGVDTTWTVTDTPTYWYTLVVHDSELLLVGGYEYHTTEITNKVFTMRGGQFVEALPPMKERRETPSAVSSWSALVVAGGCDASGDLSSVEVFKDGQWMPAPSLPSAGYGMQSALHGDQWYLKTYQGKVFCVLLPSLISGSDLSPWETLPYAPNRYSAAAFFGGRLLSVGGGDYGGPTTAIYAFSSSIQSWKHAADLPRSQGMPTAVVLSNEQLIVSNRARVFHGKLCVTPFDADSYFTMRAIDCLKASAGISVIEQLVEHTPTAFLAVADVDVVREMYDNILEDWASGSGPHPPTWAELFRVLREMGLSELAGRMEKYLRGSVPEDPPRPPPDEEGDDLEEQKDDETPEQENLRLNNMLAEYISANTLLMKENIQLKKTNINLEQEIARLKSEEMKKEQLDPEMKKEQLDPETIKEEPTSGNDHQLPSSTLEHIKQETKAEPQTTDGITERHYIASLYHFKVSPSISRIHIVVTWNTDIHSEAVDQQYRKKRAVLEQYSALEFEKDRISLDIKNAVTLSGWEIKALAPPLIITKREVDDFTGRGQWIPALQLQANRLETKAKLECALKLDGAIRPTQLNISIPFSNSTLDDICEDDERYENQLCIEGLQDVYSLLIKASKDWFDMGLALGIQVDILEGIDSNKNSDKARLREMLTHWLRSSPSRTWSDIFNGLRSKTVQQDVLADTIDKGKIEGCPFVLKMS